MEIKNKGRKEIDLPIETIISMYEQGDSILKLSKLFGVSRDTIFSRLEKFGVTRRNQSEAAFLRMFKLTEDERKAASDLLLS